MKDEKQFLRTIFAKYLGKGKEYLIISLGKEDMEEFIDIITEHYEIKKVEPITIMKLEKKR